MGRQNGLLRNRIPNFNQNIMFFGSMEAYFVWKHNGLPGKCFVPVIFVSFSRCLYWRNGVLLHFCFVAECFYTLPSLPDDAWRYRLSETLKV